MSDERSHDRPGDRSDASSAPDPSQDSWSAWLPRLDPTTDRTPPPEEQPPPPRAARASSRQAPTTPTPTTRTTPTPTTPTPTGLPHAPPPPRPGTSVQLPHLPPPAPHATRGSGRRYPATQPVLAPGRGPHNYLVEAVLVTIFCFWVWPIGLIAIVRAASVDGRWARGDRDGAYRAARSARGWSLAALAAALLILFSTMFFGWVFWAVFS